MLWKISPMHSTLRDLAAEEEDALAIVLGDERERIEQEVPRPCSSPRGRPLRKRTTVGEEEELADEEEELCALKSSSP